MSEKSDRLNGLHGSYKTHRLKVDGQASNPVWLVLLIGILFLILGLMRGEPYQVWLRAVQICLGCIGIG